MPHRISRRALAAALLLGSVGIAAQHVPGSEPIGLRGDFGGSWFNPEQPGHGLQLEILDGNRAVIAWYTFDPAGNPLWLYGLGELGTLSISGTLFQVQGGRFPPQFDPAAIELDVWGEVSLQFEGCDSGSLSWTAALAGFDDGSMPLARVTSPQGTRCNVEETFAEQRILSFERGAGAFEPLFADLPVEGQEIYELDFDWAAVPEPLAARRGLRITGHNRSDDLAMLIKAPIGGLLPETSYRTEIEVELATDVPRNCVGVGGAPGEGLYVKLGTSTTEPEAVEQVEGNTRMLRLNVDFGNQSQGGENGRVVGDLTNSQDCDSDDPRWELKTLSTQGQRFNSRTDAQGRLWVLAGTDSAFEGLTSYYFTALRVRLDPVTGFE